MRSYLLGASVLALASVFACSSSSGGSGFGNGGGSGGGSGSSGSGGSGSGGSGSGGSSGSGSSSGGIGGTINGGSSGGGTTGDGGFVCAPNPANYDIPGNGCDDDGDGKVDNVTICDNGTMPPANLTAAGTAADMMAAMGLCQLADSTHWGVVSATYTNGHTQTGPGTNNFDEQHGTLSTFGSVIVPREGSLLGALSSGSATAMDSDMGPQFKGQKKGMQGATPKGAQNNSGDVPAGFPAKSGSCSVSNVVNDVIDVKASIKVPANAKGFSFDLDFWSGEWPDYVCSSYNDSFIAYLTSAAFQSGTAGNISFDTNSNPISVNSNFFQSCTPNVGTGCGNSIVGTSTGTSTCSLGPAELAGTGFGLASPPQSYCTGSAVSTSGGATSWLTSTAPAKPGETLSIEFIIWDTGDSWYDSSVLLDNWTWQPQEVPATPITQPSPPK